MTTTQPSLDLPRKVTLCIQNQQWHQAKHHCQRLLEDDPHDAQVHQLMGLIYVQLASSTTSEGKRHEYLHHAIEAFEAATRNAPQMFDAFLNLGNALMQSNRSQDALQAFESALTLNPNSDLVHANRAEACRQLGYHSQALDSLGRAVQIAPQKHGYLVKLGNLFRELGRHEEAVVCYEQAIQIEPDQAEAYAHMAISMEELGHHDAAQGCCKIALEIDPSQSLALYHRALLEMNRNDQTAALASLNAALELQPQSTSAWLNKSMVLIKQKNYSSALSALNRVIELGVTTADVFQYRATCHEQLDQIDPAINDLEKALSIDPKHAASLMTLGVISQKMGRLDSAIHFYTQALEQDPGRVEAYSNLGAVLFETKRFENALITLEAAIEIDPTLVNAWNNLGATLMELYRFEESIAAFDQVLRLEPNHVDAYCHKGLVLHNLYRIDEALICYDRALSLDPNSTLAHWNKAIALLLKGDLKRGWSEYEVRWAHKNTKLQLRDYQQPRLTAGTSVKDKHVFVYQEQGMGDTLMFARFIPTLIEQGAQVSFEVQPGLVQLMARCLPQARIISMGQPAPAFDLHTPLLSLPGIWGIEESTLTNTRPYLSASPAKVTHWNQRLGVKKRPRIGLVWSGNPDHQNDRNRSMSLHMLLQAMPKGFDYISLQNLVRAEDLSLLNESSHIITSYADELKDFEDTAAICQCLDLVISVDTSVAHLSAALGQKTWVLIPHSPDWRWMQRRADTPWYPSLQLYRQQVPGSWHEPLRKISTDLASMFDGNSCATDRIDLAIAA